MLSKRVAGAILLLAAVALGASAQPHPRFELHTAAARTATVQTLTRRATAQREQALLAALAQGWPLRGETPDGRAFELLALRDGRPLYAITLNRNAGISTAADQVRDTAPFKVDGSTVTIGVWDAGTVRPTHQELAGRVMLLNQVGNHNHATHVGGTIGAAGVDADALGMAPAVTLHSYDWFDDLSEMADAAATESGEFDALYLSNHSYGFLTGWAYGSWSGSLGWHWWGALLADREDRAFGRYGSTAQDWDALCHAAPYFLPVTSAGNDRGDGLPGVGTSFYYWDGEWTAKPYDTATDPFADNHKAGGYNTIGYMAGAKNVLTVGAVTAAVSGGTRDITQATMSNFSCWGPADDGRIKPDIVASGVSVYSAIASSDTSYGSSSGTSMSAPNAAGSAILLAAYYRMRFPGGDMRAATLKGLIIHTADELGTTGPDYRFGWGLMNTAAAAAHIARHTDEPDAQAIVESALAAGQTNRYTFTWNGTDPLRATVSWTDPPGPAQTGLNVTTPALVNDLNLRLVGPDNTVYFPYILDPQQPEAAATTGINSRDNVEQVFIPASVLDPDEPAFFHAEVTHAGTLTGSAQAYTLLVSGQAEIKPPRSSLFRFD